MWLIIINLLSSSSAADHQSRQVFTFIGLRATAVISSNDWRSLFCSHSGPEPCENHYVAETGRKGPLFKLKPSRSHLLIKPGEVKAREKARRRLSKCQCRQAYSHIVPPIKNALAVRVRPEKTRKKRAGKIIANELRQWGRKKRHSIRLSEELS